MADAKPTRYDNLKKRQKYERLYGKMRDERSSWEQDWRNLGDYILPRRTRFLVDEDNRDLRRQRTNKIVDSTATRAARTLQSGFHSGVSSPSRPWFKLTTPDPKLAEFAPVKAWLHRVTTRMHTIFLKSNLYNILPTLYGDLGTFGSPAMSILEDDEELMRGYSYPIGSFFLQCSRRGVVNGFAMEYKMTVEQIVEEFAGPANDPDWTNISPAIKNQWEKASYLNKHDIVWMILPNPEFDPEKFQAKYKRWLSCYWEKGDNRGMFLRESGFNEFPILAPRWHVTGADWYASDCPGMTGLGDVRELQTLKRRKAQMIEVGINPSLQAPESLRTQKISLRPGDVAYLSALQLSKEHKITPIRDVNLMALRYLIADIQDVRLGINEAFFKDLFLMLQQNDGRMTAREVAERHEEKLLMLGPVLERMNDELYDPLIDRAYAIMDRQGMIPPPPKELQGMTLKVEYTSIMAQAQKLVGASAISGFLQSTVPLIETFPIVRYKLNPGAIVDEYADIYGVNPKFIVSDEDAEKAYQQALEQQQKQQQLEQVEQASKAAKNLAGSDMDSNTALSRILQGAQS